MSPRRRWAPLLLVLASACDGGHELAVDVRTDLVPGQEFDAVRVTLDEVPAPSVTAATGDDFASPRRVAELSGVAAGHHFVEVQLLRRGALVVGRRVSVRLEAGLIVMVVLTRDCRGVMCPGGGDDPGETECLGGRCVDPECSALDPGSCGEAECGEASDCASDTECVAPACVEGVCLELPGAGTCGAAEYCQPGVGCVPLPSGEDAGAPDAGACSADAQCDDAIDCTIDRCEGGSCAHTPDDVVCTAGVDARCDPFATGADPVTGCTSAECSPATCVAGACETATCVEGRCTRASTCADGETCCASGVCALDCGEATACVGMPGGTVCRAARGPCDAEERCDGASPGCPPDALRPSSEVCRAAAGDCDVAESCTGTADDCPVDAFAPLGASCTGGSCNGLGACLAGCTPGAPCSTGNACELGVFDCSGASPSCVASGFAPPSTVCRASAGPCDVAETCTGSSASCPSDAFAGASTTCRPSAGPCDLAETCTGTSAACPADGFRPGTFQCRASAGACDVAESCTGSGPACPADAFATSGVCRASAGACDVAESCNGSGPHCPADAFLTSGVCRTSAGPCDLAESCNGSGPSCPADAFRSSSFVCRSSAGPCDVAETCTGSSAPCPTDGFASAGTVCDATIAGPCDLADVCTGSSASCPARYASSTTVCRASGTGDTQCDPPERCTGSSVSCPADYVEPNGTWCNGPNCGFESCNAGVCTGGFTCTGGRTCQCGGEVCLAMGEACP